MGRNIKPRIVRHGFTMIELMIVVAIIAIAAAIVVPMASSAGGMQLRAAVTMVAADLEYAKSMSISRGHRYAVVFNKNTESYQIEDLSKPSGDPARIIEHPIRKGFRYVVSFANDSRLSHVDIVDANFDGTNTVSFDYLGSPLNGNDANLNSGVITLRAAGITRTVSVQPVTGYISISN
jgi:prepilin-type N-terminal cleavage/methylation domain-containing protein